MPDVPEFARLREPVPSHVARIARAQMDALRMDYPEATGGTLVMAVVQPGRVDCSSIYDLTADRPIWAPGALSLVPDDAEDAA